MNFYIFRPTILFFCFCGSTCFSQDIFSKVKYQFESGVYISTYKKNPFWLRSNQYGIVPLESQFLTTRGAVHKEYDSTKNEQDKLKKFSYGFGGNFVTNVGNKSSLFLPEAYFKVRYGAFEVYGGRRKEKVGLVDTTLTSGAYIWSGNALPMPKIQISIPNYLPIIGHDLISIKGAFAHGWFGNQDIFKNYYLHQKWFYSRIGKPKWKIKFYAGFNHQVVYGGTRAYLENGIAKKETYPSDIKSYIWVVSGFSLNRVADDKKGSQGANDVLNRVGNHLGSIDLAGDIELKNVKIFIYRQNFYDDGSLFYLNNIEDGLNGITFVLKNLKEKRFRFDKVSFEYFNSTSQGGSDFGGESTIPQLRGKDSYFNNYTSWTYNKLVIGTPLMTPFNQINTDLITKYKITNYPNSYIVNNRIRGYFIAISSKTQKMNFTTKLMWTNNLGTYGAKFYAKQFSFMQQLNYQLPNYTLIADIALDRGELYSNHLGCYFGIRRTFI